MKNDMTAVRNLLIKQLQDLVDPEDDKPVDIEKAKAVANIGKVLVESAKAEVLFLKVMQEEGLPLNGTGFIKNTKQLADGHKSPSSC